MKRRTAWMLAAAWVLTATPSAPAAETEEPSPAEEAEPVALELGATAVTFAPRVVGEAVSLTVGCTDGTYLERAGREVAPVRVELVSGDGSPVGDGLCKYELRVHPPVDHEAVRAAEEADDDRRLEELARQEEAATVTVRGSFRVEQGVIAGRSGASGDRREPRTGDEEQEEDR